MNLTEWRAKRDLIAKMAKDFEFVIPGCQQCKHFDFGKCAASDMQPIPPEFISQREQCDAWEHDRIPF